jgi:hypothetical protein
VFRPDLQPYERERLARNRREGRVLTLGLCVVLIVTPISVGLMAASGLPPWVFRMIWRVLKTLS